MFISTVVSQHIIIVRFKMHLHNMFNVLMVYIFFNVNVTIRRKYLLFSQIRKLYFVPFRLKFRLHLHIKVFFRLT